MKKVTAALLTKEGKILIAKRRSTDKLANKWEFPGGKIEEGETPEECLIREMREEFRINVTLQGFLERSIYEYENGTIELLAYWAKTEDDDLQCMVHDEYRWVTIDELGAFDFAPADIPFVKRLMEEGYKLSKNTIF